MKHLFLIILAVALLCGGCITDSNDTSDDLIGLWQGSFPLTFRADGSYYCNMWGKGSYSASDNTLKLHAVNSDRTYDYSLRYYQDGDFLTVIDTDANGNKSYYDFLRTRP